MQQYQSSKKATPNNNDDLTPIEGIYFSFVKANGLSHRLASPTRNLGSWRKRKEGVPLVLFLHGFPESWYSWRHQLCCLKKEPFLAVAPDMRGYGSTSQPKSVEDYTQPVLARDVVEIAKALGYDQFIVIGHDWGAALAWSVSLLYPNHVVAVCGMSVPYAGTPKMGFLTMLQAINGPCLDPKVPRETRQKAKFHYMLHHCLPGCAKEYDRNARDFLFRMYGFEKGCEFEQGTPEYDVHGLMFPPTGNARHDATRELDARAAPGLWQRIPRPKVLPHWINKADLEYYIQEFERAGFHGGLCWYRAMDRNFELIKSALRNSSDKIFQPSLFLIGDNDGLVKMYGGKQKIVERVKANVLGLTREPIFLKGCGHWIQQEKAQEVNFILLHFLNEVMANLASRQHSRL